MRRLARWPLAWGSGFAAGVALAAVLGPHAPTWGVALAFPSVALLFAIGAWKESASFDKGEEITHLLRFTLAGTTGFLLLSVPLTLARLADLVDAATPDDIGGALERAAYLRMRLLARWAVLALALPAGITALLVRRDRAARGSREAAG